MSEPVAKPNGFKALIHSPLITGLILMGAGQAIVFGIAVSSNFWRTNNLAERVVKIEAGQERMDQNGTNHSHWVDEQQAKDIAVLQSQMEKMKEYSGQFEVIKSEHRRLTKDVEDIKDDRSRR